MKLSSVLMFEARKHPHLNQKISINSVIRREYDKAEKLPSGVTNSFVSFTSIEKLGINPQSRFNTPIGIYCYPSEYVLDRTTYSETGKTIPMKALPFAGQQPYGNVFSVTGNIIRIDNMDSVMYWEYIEMLKNLLKTKYSDIKGIMSEFELLLTHSYTRALYRSIDGGRFWYITMMLSTIISKSRDIKSPVIWNSLFRDIGIDGVVDMGVGVIHTAERTQAVIFKLSAIKNIVRVHNKYSDTEMINSKSRGKINKENISNLHTLSEHDQIVAVIEKNQLINYVKSTYVRNRVLDYNAEIIFLINKPTKEDIIRACQSSNLYVLIGAFNHGDPIPSMTSNYTKASYKNKYASQLKNVQLQQQIKKVLSETDIIHLIKNYLNIGGDHNIKMCETLLTNFPTYDDMFIELLQKIPSTIFAIFDYLSSHYKQVMKTYCEELGEKNPDDNLYTRYKRHVRVTDKYNKRNGV